MRHVSPNFCSTEIFYPTVKFNCMYKPSFTRDPVRIQILERNFEEGVTREKIPFVKRSANDVELMKPDALHISQLRRACGLP
jgi:hypothetical protein